MDVMARKFRPLRKGELEEWEKPVGPVHESDFCECCCRCCGEPLGYEDGIGYCKDCGLADQTALRGEEK